MKLINFDKHFQEYTARWMREHGGDYQNFDAMEQDMPNVYLRFLNAPADWLDGVTPAAYFTQFEDAKELVDWLAAYCEGKVPVPDQLMDRILEVGLPCEKRLVALLKDENAGREAKMTCIGLLREMESAAPKMLYIEWQKNRAEKDELCDNALESLEAMGQSVVQPILSVMDQATRAGQEAFLDVLANYPGNEKVFQLALRLFKENKRRRALFASYLGKLNDGRALPALMEAAGEEQLGYLDYIEIRNAIEMLGGDAPEREFPEDAAYEAMLRLQ